MTTRKPGIDAATQAILDKARATTQHIRENSRRIEAGLRPIPHAGEHPAKPRIDAATQAVIDRARATVREANTRMDQLSDEQNRDFDRLERETRNVMSVLPERTRDEVRAVDQFSREVGAEDRLLKEQEARWAEEDRKAGRK